MKSGCWFSGSFCYFKIVDVISVRVVKILIYKGDGRSGGLVYYGWGVKIKRRSYVEIEGIMVLVV